MKLIKNHFTAAECEKLLAGVPEIRARLLANCRQLEQHPHPVLLVGDCYPGIWLEHNQDNLFLAEYDPQSAWASQEIFMNYQRKDGLLPFMFPVDPRGGHFKAPAVYWQVQCVYPFARCALEVARQTGRPEADFARIYQAGCRYDAWFGKYRNRAGTGLAEMYCEYDTGHDNNPRVTDGGIPGSCPNNNAVNMPDLAIMPVLSVDLSAMLYGHRAALAELAAMLGKERESIRWRESGELLRQNIKKYLYDAETDFYYDRDRHGLRKYRSEHITRLFLNQVFDQSEFDRIYGRYFENDGEFRTPYPFPSMSIADPAFDRNCPKNSWSSNTQALTSLRALLWLRQYKREDERNFILMRWLRAFLDHPTDYPQEINPFDGSPVGDGKYYTPTLILYLEGVKLLSGDKSQI